MANVGERRTGFWILIGVLAVSGIVMALIALFGLFDSIAFDLVWRVFLADLYIIASLAAQHRWQRLAVWISIGVAFVLGVVNVFWRYTPYYQWADGREEMTTGDYSTGWSPWFGLEQDLEYGAHTIVVGLILLGFVSLAYRWVKSERVLRAIYMATFVTGLAASVLGAVLIVVPGYYSQDLEGLEKLVVALVILALTAAAIVTIGAFVQRNAARRLAPHAAFGHTPTDAPATSISSNIHASGTDQAAMRALVRQYVDEYLAERERGVR